MVGSNPAAFAAAIQSAHSGVRTILVDSGNFSLLSFDPREADLFSGVYKTFIKHVESAQRFPVKKDQQFSPSFVATFMRAWTDTIKNMDRMPNKQPVRVERAGRGWVLYTNDNKTIKCDAIIDGTANHEILKLAAATQSTDNNTLLRKGYVDQLYRTSVAVIARAKIIPPCLPLKCLLTNKSNLLITGNDDYGYTTSSGQAAGAAAAYCAFYKKESTQLNIRAIQSELIKYGSALIYFDDLHDSDPYFSSVQATVLSGILKGMEYADSFHFNADSLVTFNEIRAAFKELYPRSQIWFLDNHGDHITVKDILSLIKFVALRGKELDAEIQNGWTTTYHFKEKYDLQYELTRYQFAILTNAYIRPFLVGIDLSGQQKR